MNKKFRIVMGLLFVAIGVTLMLTNIARSESTASWPQFHGPKGDNISNETGLLKSWPEGGPEMVWRTEGLGHGFSSVVVADGRIITAGNIGTETVITAVDMNGKSLWQVKNGEGWNSKPAYPGTRGTPTIDGDFVYHENPHGNVMCLEAATGKIVWEVNVLKKYNGENIRWALSESVIIDGDNLIATPQGPEVSFVALNKKTGEVVWEAPSTNDAAGYSTPIIFEQSGLRIITNLTSKSLIGVNADTGELLWRVDHPSYTDQNTAMPIYRDGHVFVSTIKGDAVKWRVIVDGGKASLDEIWRTDELENHHGGLVLLDGNVYGTSIARNRNKWVTLDWDTGEVKQVIDAVGKASMTVADGLIYMLSIDRLMGLAKPTDSGLEMISQFEIPEGGEGKSWAHPVVAGGKLYIRHSDFLYVYDVSG
jgi:hypothetical protein